MWWALDMHSIFKCKYVCKCRRYNVKIKKYKYKKVQKLLKYNQLHLFLLWNKILHNYLYSDAPTVPVWKNLVWNRNSAERNFHGLAFMPKFYLLLCCSNPNGTENISQKNIMLKGTSYASYKKNMTSLRSILIFCSKNFFQ